MINEGLVLLWKTCIITTGVVASAMYLSRLIENAIYKENTQRRTEPTMKVLDYSTPEEGSDDTSDQETQDSQASPTETYAAVLDYPIQERVKPKKGTKIEREITDYIIVDVDMEEDDIPW